MSKNNNNTFNNNTNNNNTIITQKDLKERYAQLINNKFKTSVKDKNKADPEFREEFTVVSDSKLKVWSPSLKKVPAINVFENGVYKNQFYIERSNFKRWFDESTFTFDDLVASFIKFKKANDKIQEKLNKLQNKTNLILTRENTGEDINSKILEENLELFDGSTGKKIKYNDADDYFVFDRLFKDRKEDNADTDPLFYYRVNNNLFRLEWHNLQSGVIINDSKNAHLNLWGAMEEEFGDDFVKWESIILEEVRSYAIDETNLSSLETKISERGVPMLFLQCFDIKLIYVVNTYSSTDDRGRTTSSTHKELRSVNLKYKEGKGMPQIRRRETFKKYLFTDFNSKRVKVAPLLTNKEGEVALHYRHLPSYSHPKEAPKLPPTWDYYFSEFEENGKRYPRFHDPVHDKLKIACFVYNTLDAKYNGRQVLVLGGSGMDGKTLFIDVLRTILGENLSTTLSTKALTTNDEFGLASIVGKKLICMPDQSKVGQLFNTDLFKSITGGDTLTINRKYKAQMNYKPSGVTVIISTNSDFQISNDYATTRILPLVNLKNFTKSTQMDKDELKQKLLAEKDEFIQWCVDYRCYLNDKFNGKLLVGGGSELIMISDEDLRNGELEKNNYTPSQLFSRAVRNQMLDTPSGRKQFCTYGNQSKEDDYEEFFYPLFHQVFEKIETKDASECMTAREMANALETYFLYNKEYLDLFDTKVNKDNDGGISYTIQRRTSNLKWKEWLVCLRELGVEDFGRKRFNLKERGKACVFAIKAKEIFEVKKEEVKKEKAKKNEEEVYENIII